MQSESAHREELVGLLHVDSSDQVMKTAEYNENLPLSCGLPQLFVRRVLFVPLHI